MTGNEMVERVAWAIRGVRNIDPTTAERFAEAAIAAMREPTEAMVETGQHFATRHSEDVKRRWRSMIDAALS